MLSSTTAGIVWPEPRRLVPRLLVAFALALAFTWLGGQVLAEALLPLCRPSLLWLDDRFAILHLGIDQTHQDTVIRLRATLRRMVVVGGHVTWPHPQGWLEVTTTVGAMLQPLTIALALAGAWPGCAAVCFSRISLAAVLGMLFMLVDIPLTLHAYVWNIFLLHYDPDRLSPLMLAHRFLHGGGRLAVGLLIGIGSIALASKFAGRHKR